MFVQATRQYELFQQSMYLYLQALSALDIRITLEKKQEEIYAFLRSKSGGENLSGKKSMTAVTSTIMNESGEVKTDIFILKGIVIDQDFKDPFRDEIQKETGWMITTRWITSEKLLDKLTASWEEVSNELYGGRKTKHAGLYKMGQVTEHELRSEEPTIVVPQWKSVEISQKLNVTITASHSVMKFNPKKKLFNLTTKEKIYMGSRGAQRYRYVEMTVRKILRHSFHKFVTRRIVTPEHACIRRLPFFGNGAVKS